MEAYFQPRYGALEARHVFEPSWLWAASAEKLAKEGDWVRVPTGGAGLVVARGADGRLGAFVNICAHRRTPLVEVNCGRGLPLRCPYHNWAYDATGRLVDAPGLPQTPEVQLEGVDVAVWQGSVFVRFVRGGPSLERWLDTFPSEVVDVDFKMLRVHRSVSSQVAANWKLVIENYLESYHFATVHPELDAITSGADAEVIALGRQWMGGRMPLKMPAGTVSMTGRRVGRLVATPNLVRDYLVWPNLMLSIHPDYVLIEAAWPSGPDSCQVDSTWLFHDESVRSPDFDPSDVYALCDLANAQDHAICERQQRGVSTRHGRPPLYTAEDVLVRTFSERIAAACRGGIPCVD